MPEQCAEAIRDVSGLGPYFAVTQYDGAAHWRPLADLLDPGALEERVGRTALALGLTPGNAQSRRVAASTVSLGLFSRLVSPVLGAAALDVPAPAISLRTVWWRPFDTGPWPLAVDSCRHGEPALQDVLRGSIADLVSRFAAGFSVSPKVLWGNAVAAVFGAVASLDRRGQDPRGIAAGLAVASLEQRPLHGHGQFRAGLFVRRSCCLYYRVPGAGLCSDCVLLDAGQ